jgi:hypothetical protein
MVSRASSKPCVKNKDSGQNPAPDRALFIIISPVVVPEDKGYHSRKPICRLSGCTLLLSRTRVTPKKSFLNRTSPYVTHPESMIQSPMLIAINVLHDVLSFSHGETMHLLVARTLVAHASCVLRSSRIEVLVVSLVLVVVQHNIIAIM